MTIQYACKKMPTTAKSKSTATVDVKSPISSGLESDAGASPSVSDSESESSCSSAPSLKIICDSNFTTPKKKISNCTSVTPLRSTRKKASVSTSSNKTSGNGANVIKKSVTKKCNQTPSKMMLRSGNTTDIIKTRNKRRRTKSERNRQAGKPDKTLVVAETNREEASVALDAEIDRVLEEKAVKNNLTATNVKNIIHQIITNNSVRKMIVRTVRTKNKLDENGSSDDESFYEPKLTRAKTKELMEKSQLWPIVGTPVKVLKKPSETHMLINQDLPEDSSGDEEYVPKENELHHSEDESSSVASHTSDIGSPMMPTHKEECQLHFVSEIRSLTSDSVFKTPPPKITAKNHIDSAIGLRTRSKLPLTDTSIETLEMQLIPPDITTDMYDFGVSDNEDYLDFLKEFLLPVKKQNENNDDDEADPEYNVMEEEEDTHDKEEHRRDRAVKVSKKELNALVAELFDECHLSSADEMDDLHFIQNLQGPTNSISTFDKRTSDPLPAFHGITNCPEINSSTTPSKIEIKALSPVKSLESINSQSVIPLPEELNSSGADTSVAVILKQSEKENEKKSSENKSDNLWDDGNVNHYENGTLFDTSTIETLRLQLRQHIQLLAQIYVLTASRESASFKQMTKRAKDMILEISNFGAANGPTSVFLVENLQFAKQICNEWPMPPHKSPIKKKILEERFMNDEEYGNPKEFPLQVIKLIANSPAFMYPHLLPLQYNLQSEVKLYFGVSEDCLMILGYDQLKNENLPTKVVAELISNISLPARSPDQVYHRLKNLKKINYAKGDNIISNYFKKGQIPAALFTGLDVKEPKAPKDQPIEMCPDMWKNLMHRLNYQSPYHMKKCTSKSRGKSSGRKLNFETSITPTGLSETRKSKPEKCIVSKNYFPIEHSPDVTAFPLLNSNGNPGAYVLIPNFALKPPIEVEIPKIHDSSHLAKTAFTYKDRLEKSVSPVTAEMCNSKIKKRKSTPTKISPAKFTRAEVTPPNIQLVKTPIKERVVNNSSFENLPVPVPVEKCRTATVNENCSPAKGDLFERHLDTVPKVNSLTNGQYFSSSSINSNRDNFSTPGSIESSNDSTCSPEGSVYSPVKCDGQSARTRIYIRKSKIEFETDDETIKPEGCFGPEIPEDTEDNYESESDTEFYTQCNRVIETVDLADDDSMQDSDGQGTQDGKNHTNKNSGSGGNNSDNVNRSNDGGAGAKGSGGVSCPGGGGDRRDDDDGNDRRYTNLSADEDANSAAKNDETDEDVEDEHAIPKKRIKLESCSANNEVLEATSNVKSDHVGRPIKKFKRSPAGPSKKRPSKYNVQSAAKLLEDSEQDHQMQSEVEEAFTDIFIIKVQSTVEPKSPAIYNAFIQLLCDQGENPVGEHQLYNKVAVLLKDYPELVKEFGSMLRENSSGEDDVYDFECTQESQAQIHFMKLLMKWTTDSPQLRNKILHKIKTLREDPKVTEKDVIEMAETLFLGNSVMIKAFQDLFLEIFRPQPIDSAVDFEQIDLEMEDHLDSGDDIHTEIVKIPEETCVPATNTCPCVCHSNKTNVSYTSRLKHCNKCSLKFQEGKVFVHHGRVMRPVNISMASPGSAKKIIAGTACVRCVQTSPRTSSAVPVTKESPSPPVKRVAKASAVAPTTEQPSENKDLDESEELLINEEAQNKYGDVEDEEIIEDDEDEEPKQKSHAIQPQTETSTVIHIKSSNESSKPLGPSSEVKPSSSTNSQSSAPVEPVDNVTEQEVERMWTMNEDKMILMTCQAERNVDLALAKLENMMTSRSRQEIKERFAELIRLLQSAVRSGKMENQGRVNESVK